MQGRLSLQLGEHMTGSAPRLWDLTDAEIELDGGPTLLLRLTSVMLSRMSAFELFYFNLCGGVVGVYQRSFEIFLPALWAGECLAVAGPLSTSGL